MLLIRLNEYYVERDYSVVDTAVGLGWLRVHYFGLGHR